jgi:DNA-binding NtrC family response regulator
MAMKQEVAVLSASQPLVAEIGSILEHSDYSAFILSDLTELEIYMRQRSSSVLILDLDRLPVTNHLLRELKKKHPVTLVAVSAEKVHPNLEESLRHHLFACLSKPLDPDDLLLVLEGAFA